MFKLPATLLSKDVLKPLERLDTFPEEHEYEIGFSKHYNEYVKDKVVEFEERRILAIRKARKRCIAWMVYLVLTPFLVVLLFSLQGELGMAGLFFLVFVGNFVAYYWVDWPINDYTVNVKEEIFPNVVSFFGDFKYNVETSKSAFEYHATEIIPKHDIEYAEDHITGTYKDVAIDLFETELHKTKKKNSDGDSGSTRPAFSGFILALSMNKSFNGKTIIKKDTGAIGNFWANLYSSLERVKLEDPKFEKTFEVFSDDQIEARYLLTVSFMERLLELDEIFGGSSVRCCFMNEKLVILLESSKDWFEPGSIFEADDFVDDCKSLLKELSQIFSLIDTLRLNVNTNL